MAKKKKLEDREARVFARAQRFNRYRARGIFSLAFITIVPNFNVSMKLTSRLRSLMKTFTSQWTASSKRLAFGGTRRAILSFTEAEKVAWSGAVNFLVFINIWWSLLPLVLAPLFRAIRFIASLASLPLARVINSIYVALSVIERSTALYELPDACAIVMLSLYTIVLRPNHILSPFSLFWHK